MLKRSGTNPCHRFSSPQCINRGPVHSACNHLWTSNCIYLFFGSIKDPSTWSSTHWFVQEGSSNVVLQKALSSPRTALFKDILLSKQVSHWRSLFFPKMSVRLVISLILWKKRSVTRHPRQGVKSPEVMTELRTAAHPLRSGYPENKLWQEVPGCAKRGSSKPPPSSFRTDQQPCCCLDASPILLQDTKS